VNDVERQQQTFTDARVRALERQVIELRRALTHAEAIAKAATAARDVAIKLSAEPWRPAALIQALRSGPRPGGLGFDTVQPHPHGQRMRSRPPVRDASEVSRRPQRGHGGMT